MGLKQKEHGLIGIPQCNGKWWEIRNDYANVRFLIRFVYDMLPNTANLCIWNDMESALCPLCNGQRTLRHILSSCPTAHAEGHYR